MYAFSLQIIIALSFGTVIYILGRALPRIKDDMVDVSTHNDSYMERLMRRIPMTTIDTLISSVLEKMLRKIRVANLKIENVVNAGIMKLRNGNNGKHSGVEAPVDLFEKK